MVSNWNENQRVSKIFIVSRKDIDRWGISKVGLNPNFCSIKFMNKISFGWHLDINKKIQILDFNFGGTNSGFFLNINLHERKCKEPNVKNFRQFFEFHLI